MRKIACVQYVPFNNCKHAFSVLTILETGQYSLAVKLRISPLLILGVFFVFSLRN